MKNFKIVAVLVIGFFPVLVLAGGATIEAENLYNKGNFKLAILATDYFTVNASSENESPEAWLIRGKSQMAIGQFSKAVYSFERAIQSSQGVIAQKAVNLMKQASLKSIGSPSFNYVVNRTADLLSASERVSFLSAIQQKKNQYANQLFQQAERQLQEGRLKLAKASFNQVLQLNSNLKHKVYTALISAGDKASDENCLSFYELATNYCEAKCERSKDIGERLRRIAGQIEFANINDPRVHIYRRVARMYIDMPPDVNCLKPGEYTFTVPAGTTSEQWYTFCQRSSYSLDVSNLSIEVIYYDGTIVRAWKGERIPSKTDGAKFKFRSFNEDTEVKLVVASM